MNGHPEYVELIAASIDFELTNEEFGRLSTHLARCPECRRVADELRGDATTIAAYPPPRLAPARSEQILRAALRMPPARPRWGLLAVAALLATLGGGVLFAGFQLIRDDDATPPDPPPSLIAEASVPPSAEPSEPPIDVGEAPTDAPPPAPTPDVAPPAEPASLGFPIPYDDVWDFRVAPAPHDRLWVSMGRYRESVVALLDDEGRTLPGWPKTVPDAFDCWPLAAEDGSLRLVCGYSEEPLSECEIGCEEDRVFAWTADGDELKGFPVSPSGMASGVERRDARMVGNRLVLTDQAVVDDTEMPSEFWLVDVDADGTVREGAHVDFTGRCCAISPNGIAYATGYDVTEDGTQIGNMLAFDHSGVRPGWPVAVPGSVSLPAFGPDGELVLATTSESDSQIIRLREDGTQATEPGEPFEPVMGDDQGDGPLAPLVDEDGNAFATTGKRVWGFDRAGKVLAGWPITPKPALLQYTDCPPGDTGCGYEFMPPTLAPRGLVYLVHPPGEGVSGGRISALNPDGTIRSGWPKTLQRDGGRWDSLTVGENRVAYAVAIEPEPGNQFSASVLAFAPNGTRNWITTLVEP
jgi:hypothetical protein